MKAKKCTPAEWQIMEVIWQKQTASVREVLQNLEDQGEKKAYTTIQTIMNILVKKGLLNAEKTGMVNYYTPTVKRKNMIRTETRTLLARIFKGSVPALTSFLIDSEDISLDDIERIKQTLAEKENKLKDKEK